MNWTSISHLFLLVVLVSLPVGDKAGAAPPSASGWELVWNDEFDGTAMDLSKWRHWLPGARRDAVNSPSAVSVGSGLLTISTYTSGGVHYTGMISTQDTYNPAYGYIEARINYDDSPGMWSAFWMQSPTMGSPVGVPNAAGTEIDICEHRKVDGSSTNIDGLVVENIHWDGYGADTKSIGANSGSIGLGTGFHVYGMEWTPTQQKFYIDGVLKWTVNDASGSPVSQRTEFLILSSEVDSTSTTWAGAIPSGGYGNLTTTTTKMEIDYVRVYQRRETVVNGDFEGQLAPFFSVNQGSWSATGGHSAAASGKVAPTTSAGASVEQTVRGLMPSTGYVLTAWGDPGAVSPALMLGAKNYGGNLTGQTLTVDGYAKATVPFTTGTGNRTARVFASSTSVGSTGYADDFFLRRAATVNNGQLEKGDASAWTNVYGGASVSSSGETYGGDYALSFPVSASSAGAEQEVVGLLPNTTYRLTGWTDNAGSGLAFGVKNYGGAQVLANVSASTWTRGAVNFTTGAGNSTATIFAYRPSGSAVAYADAFFLSEPLSAPWTSQDVTALPFGGTAGTLGDHFVIQASGADIGGTSDKMHFVSQAASGDTMITAHILGVDSTNLLSKTGVMIREGAGSSVRSAMVAWTRAQTLEFTRRATVSGTSSKDTVPSVAVPPWVRLARRGNVFTAYSSSDGITWSRIGSPQTISMNASTQAGIPACSGDNGTLTEFALDNVSVAVPTPDVLITSPVDGTSFSGLGSSLAINATITNSASQGTPVVAWSKVSGPGTVAFGTAAAASTSAGFSSAGTYVLRCSATSAAGAGSDEVTVKVSDDPVADPTLALRLKLDEASGSIAADSSGYGLQGTAAGGIAWQPSGGVLAGAADFNGTDASLSVPDNASLDGTSAFTLSFWFKANSLNGAGLVAKRVNFNDRNSYSTFLGIDGKLNVDIDSSDDRFTSTTVFNSGVWYHVALVFDGSLAAASRAKLYVNGLLDVTANETSSSIPNYASPLNVGILNAGTTAFFDGLIDDVRFYRRAMAGSEVAVITAGTGSFAPFVSVGAAPPVTTGVAANLSGSVLSEAGSVPAISWSKVSGPGAVTFGNAASASTGVTIDQPGTYVLRLTATNGSARVFSELTVTAALPRPVVSIISPPAPVYLGDAADVVRISASASSNGVAGTPSIMWTKFSGPGSVVFGNATSPDTTASFSLPGSYVLRCSATTTGGTTTADAGVAVAAQPALAFREGVDGCVHVGSFLRSDVSTWNSGARDQMLVGKVSAASLFRTVFSFPLAGIPSTATLAGISLDLWTDSTTGAGAVAALELHELVGVPIEGIGASASAGNITGNGTGVTWDSRTGLTGPGDLWASPGGDYGNATLSSLSGYDATVTGAKKSFPSSPGWIAAAQAAVQAGQPLNLIVLSPGTESGANNQFTRFSSDDTANVAQRPQLSVTWSANPAPVLAPGPVPLAYSGIPAPLGATVTGAVTTAWSSVSGSGSAAFANAAQPATTVTFSQSGNYVIKLTAANSAGEISRTLAVAVAPPPNPAIFAQWQALTWPGVTDPSVVGPDKDPDGDGLPNLMEWALGLDAKAPGIFPAKLVRNGNALEYVYIRRVTAPGEAVFQVEWSDSLAQGSWSSAGVGESILSDNGSMQSVKATVPAGAGDRRFLRLRVTAPAP